MKRQGLSAEFLKQARKRLIQMHHESGVGHVGGNLSALDAMLVTFHEQLAEGDEFVLSKGHAAGALYIALWSVGIVEENDLKKFHKDETLLSGHPPANKIDKITFSTGSLGHGLSLAAGTALAFKLKNTPNKVVCLTSDGEWQEGSTWEALIFACHHRLDNLTVLVDHNELQGFGSTAEVASMSPLWEKLSGFDLDVQIVDGHNLEEIRTAMDKPANLPKVVVMRTIKGYGVSFMQHKMEWHYLPINAEQYQQAIKEIDES